MVYLGQEMRYIPCWIKHGKFDEVELKESKVTGKVIYVNYQNEYFTVEAPCGGTMQRESFKFSQIGKDICIVRGGKYGS